MKSALPNSPFEKGKFFKIFLWENQVRSLKKLPNLTKCQKPNQFTISQMQEMASNHTMKGTQTYQRYKLHNQRTFGFIVGCHKRSYLQSKICTQACLLIVKNVIHKSLDTCQSHLLRYSSSMINFYIDLMQGLLIKYFYQCMIIINASN